MKFAESRVASVKKSLGDNPVKTHNYYGGQNLGYWEGRMTAYENVLDFLEKELSVVSSFKFNKDESVRIRDGFAFLGMVATIHDASIDSSGFISYKLKEVPGWWPQSSLEKVL
jgi:hypothetical protein